MPLLLTESLDPAARERTHQHIEDCALCSEEWAGYKETWALLDELPQVPVPPRVRERFLAEVLPPAPTKYTTVVPFHRKPAFRWLAQAAAVVIVAGGGYLAGHRTAPAASSAVGVLNADRPAIQATPAAYQTPLTLAETRVLPASALSPTIEGRPDISNLRFVDADPRDNNISVSFDITSRWTVTGSPTDRSMVRLLSYVLEKEDAATPRSAALDWVRKTYSDPAYADPEIANSLAKVLRTDEHEGVRIRAVETLMNLPLAVSAQTRNALIEALKTDPNPAVRIKAVEALANLAKDSGTLDPAAVDTLRAKASQDDENLYVRVKAAEALSTLRP